MALAACTGQLLVDLDDSGAFATDLGTLYWKREGGIQLRGRGRNKEHDAAGSASLIGALDNRDGRFSPKNTGSPYYPNWTAYKQAKVKLAYNAVTYDIITGILTDIKVDSSNRQQLCEFVIRDFMFLLSRTDIRRPLMRDQYTGVIIHRLLDDVEGAEDREAVANSHFEVDLTGYSVSGTATLTRMTDMALEGPASMQVATSAVNSGATYETPGSIAGLKYTVSAYVKPETDAEVGKNVHIRARDGGGGITSSSNVTLENKDYWQRIDVTRTFSAVGPQYIDVRAAESGATFRVGAVHAVPFVAAFVRDIDNGQSQLKQYSYHRGPALQAVQEVRADEGLALFYFDGSGTARFEDRHHRWRESPSLTSQYSNLGPGDFERGILDYSESGDDRIRGVRISYPHFVDGEAGTVHWELDRVIPIPPSNSATPLRVPADYNGGLLRDTITPVAGTDYTINASGDGSGASMLGSVTFTFLDFGAGSQGTFVNTTANTLYLRSYRVRGTPVKLSEDATAAEYTSPTGPALAATVTYPEFRYNGSEPSAQSLAEYIGLRYSVQRERLGAKHSAAFPNADITTSDMVAILARQVSDRVTYTNDNLPFSLKLTGVPYYIDSIDLRCTGESMEASWRLSPVDDDYWVVEEAGSLLDTNTRLAA